MEARGMEDVGEDPEGEFVAIGVEPVRKGGERG